MPSRRVFRSLVATALVFLLMLALSGLCFSALASEGEGGGAASSSAFNRDEAQQEYNDLQTNVKENREKIKQLESSIKAGQATAEQATAQKNYYINEAALV